MRIRIVTEGAPLRSVQNPSTSGEIFPPTGRAKRRIRKPVLAYAPCGA